MPEQGLARVQPVVGFETRSKKFFEDCGFKVFIDVSSFFIYFLIFFSSNKMCKLTLILSWEQGNGGTKFVLFKY